MDGIHVTGKYHRGIRGSGIHSDAENISEPFLFENFYPPIVFHGEDSQIDSYAVYAFFIIGGAFDITDIFPNMDEIIFGEVDRLEYILKHKITTS
jgi:hypothetical protein